MFTEEREKKTTDYTDNTDDGSTPVVRYIVELLMRRKGCGLVLPTTNAHEWTQIGQQSQSRTDNHG
jgi:hypothetical protein